MGKSGKQYKVRLAENEADVRAAQALRYRVFVQELGGDGPMVDHVAQLEVDEFDAASEHLLLIDEEKSTIDAPHVVGAYRMMTSDHAASFGRFYSASEYDLTPLTSSGRKLLELGRSCVHPDYRGGTSMYLLWNALARYVLDNDVLIMFGVASFHGTDVSALAQPLANLHHNHLAPEDLRVRAKGSGAHPMDILPADAVDPVNANKLTPALIKAYIRLGGFVGQGAFLDHSFNTTDVCLVMDTENMNAKSRETYIRKANR